MAFLADLTMGTVTGLVGSIGTLAKDIKELWTGEPSPEKQAEITQRLMELESKAMEAQMLINVEEAKSEHLFVAGWRPFIGWVGGIALAYASILNPFMTWIAKAYGSTIVFPTLDTTITMQVLFGILGLGAFRSYDKKQEPNVKGKE